MSVIKLPAALTTWLSIQTAALALGAARIPLWARAGIETQHLALAEMLVAQFVATTLLFSALVRNWNGIAIAATALPFVQLAAFLSSTPPLATLAVSVHIILWIIGLNLWANAISGRSSEPIVRSAFAFLVIGMPLAGYVVNEFSDSAMPSLLQMSPLSTAIGQIPHATVQITLLAPSISVLLSGTLLFLFRRKKFHLAPSYPHPAPPHIH